MARAVRFRAPSSPKAWASAAAMLSILAKQCVWCGQRRDQLAASFRWPNSTPSAPCWPFNFSVITAVRHVALSASRRRQRGHILTRSRAADQVRNSAVASRPHLAHRPIGQRRIAQDPLKTGCWSAQQARPA